MKFEKIDSGERAVWLADERTQAFLEDLRERYGEVTESILSSMEDGADSTTLHVESGERVGLRFAIEHAGGRAD